MTLEIINPESLGVPRGWNHGLLGPAGGRVLFVAGQTALDASGRVPNTGFVDQFANALENVLTVVREAGGGPTDIARMTVYVTDIVAYRASRKPLGEAYRGVMGKHFPAMALVEAAALVDSNAKVEIEATAVIGD